MSEIDVVFFLVFVVFFLHFIDKTIELSAQ